MSSSAPDRWPETEVPVAAPDSAAAGIDGVTEQHCSRPDRALVSPSDEPPHASRKRSTTNSTELPFASRDGTSVDTRLSDLMHSVGTNPLTTAGGGGRVEMDEKTSSTEAGIRKCSAQGQTLRDRAKVKTTSMWEWALDLLGQRDRAGVRILQALASGIFCALIFAVGEAQVDQDQTKQIYPDANQRAFFEAIAVEDKEAVRRHLSAGVDPNARGKRGITALMVAVSLDNYVIVGQLLRAGADPNVRSADGDTPLTIAAALGGTAVVRLLISAGANPNMRRENGETALSMAIRLGRLNVAKVLIGMGAKPDIVVRDELIGDATPLMLLMARGHFLGPELLADISLKSSLATPEMEKEAAQVLIAAGADPNHVNSHGSTPLMAAALSGNETGVKLLLEAGANPNAVNRNGHNVLMHSVLRSDVAITEILIAAGADPNHTSQNGVTALMLASTYGDAYIWEALMGALRKANKNPKRVDTSIKSDLYEDLTNVWARVDRTVVDIATETDDLDRTIYQLVGDLENNVRISQLLIDSGADPNGGAFSGETPLMMASYFGYERIVRLLIQAGADPNQAAAGNVTALLFVVMRGSPRFAKFLKNRLPIYDSQSGGNGVQREMGVRIAELLYTSRSDPKVMSERAITEMARALIEAGANPNVAFEGESALVIATRNKYASLVKLLVDAGADLGFITPDGRTPLMIAEDLGNMKIAGQLLAADTHTHLGGSSVKSPNSTTGESSHPPTDTPSGFIGWDGVIGEDLCGDVAGQPMPKNPDPSLVRVVKLGNLKATDLLLSSGVNVNSTDAAGRSVLYWAAYGGNLNLVKLLVAAGADVDASDAKGWNSLIVATAEGHHDVVEHLAKVGANVNSGNGTALRIAAERNQYEMIRILVEAGADTGLMGNINSSAQIQEENHCEIARLYVDAMRRGSANRLVDLSLIEAARKNHRSVANFLLKAGGDVNATDDEGKTPLIWAVHEDHPKMTKLLIMAGADVDKTDSLGQTALVIATKENNYAAADILLDAGASVRTRTKEGLNAYHIAHTKGRRHFILKYKPVPIWCAVLSGLSKLREIPEKWRQTFLVCQQW